MPADDSTLFVSMGLGNIHVETPNGGGIPVMGVILVMSSFRIGLNLALIDTVKLCFAHISTTLDSLLWVDVRRGGRSRCFDSRPRHLDFASRGTH